MSEITISQYEITETFTQLREVTKAIAEADSRDEVESFFRSFGANMGVDEDGLDRWIAEYMANNSEYLAQSIVDGGVRPALNVAGTWMSRAFYVGLVLGRQHPVK